MYRARFITAQMFGPDAQRHLARGPCPALHLALVLPTCPVLPHSSGQLQAGAPRQRARRGAFTSALNQLNADTDPSD